MLQIMFLVSLENSRQGVHGLGSMTFGLVVQKLLKFSEELECAFDVLGKIMMSRI
jgi:hypothetical protein